MHSYTLLRLFDQYTNWGITVYTTELSHNYGRKFYRNKANVNRECLKLKFKVESIKITYSVKNLKRQPVLTHRRLSIIGSNSDSNLIILGENS